jgi:hypothetical protein
MEAVLKFLRDFANAECRAQRAMILERDDKKLKKLISAWDAMHSGLRSGLSRPENLPSEVFEEPSQIEEAENTKPRTVFAVARYKQGKADLYRAWMGDTSLGPRGESLTQNLYVADVEGDLKVVSRYRRCSTCLGTLKLPNGKKCPECWGQGWEHRGGVEIKKLGAAKEVRKLAEPSDPMSKPLYDAIEEPA